MAEWATLKVNQGIRKGSLALDMTLLPLLLGGLLARGSVLGLHPFGIAIGAALIMRGGRGVLFGLLGVVLGTLTLKDVTHVIEVSIILGALSILLPHFRVRRNKNFFLSGISALFSFLVILVVLSFGEPSSDALILAALESALIGGLAIIFYFALGNQDAVWRGEFTREQGMAWLLILIGVVAGVQGISFGLVNLSIVILSFFILFISRYYGAGTAAGVGALLGFIPQLTFDISNLYNAGLYGLAGFCTGAFQRFGKLITGIAFASVILLFTFFLRQEVYSQLVSSGIGFLLFLLWPDPVVKSFERSRQVPEVESAVTKVRALAHIFDEIALSYQAAEAEAYKEKPEVPELINVLVERVCKNCPTFGVCWEREFYKTYHYLMDLFAKVEAEPQGLKEVPVEWKRHCGRLKEMILGVQFIVEQQQSHEAWRQRLANNREALSRQFQSVSHVIGNLAKELHARHNIESSEPSSLARRRRHFLDVGVGTVTCSGKGVSGDNYASVAFSPTQHAFIISDGMGIGEPAAKMSAAALTLLEQLLNTGFEPEGAVQALNSILVLRSPEESFVTVDMAILDLESDRVKLIKVGASPTYIRTEDDVLEYSTSSLPVGILNQIEIPVIEIEVKIGDILILVTDGIQDVLKDGSDWLRDFLTRFKSTSSQEIADEIVREARRLSQGTMEDDGVVLVVRKNYWNKL